MFHSGQNSFYYIGSMFEMLVMLKIEMIANQILSTWPCMVDRNLMGLSCIHNSIKCSPKPRKILCCVLQMAADTDFSTSLLTYFIYFFSFSW